MVKKPSLGRSKLRAKVGDIPREIPVRLGRYLIDSEIGRGAMGIVYRAHQDGLDRIVALKLLITGVNASDAHKRRFEREARAIAKLRHPNIISVHEVGEYENQPFFTMDYIDGLPLDTFMEKNGISSTRLVADMCARICDAVSCAHENGIIHRDLKPGNILVDHHGNPMVMDFGLAKDLYSNSMVSMTGDIMGTPAYMSPEQAGGHVSATGERSDVYSLGAILYCMLTKEPPFRGNTLMETLGRVMNEDPPPLVNVNPMIEGELGAICMKAMEKVPSMRYKSAAEMARDLRAFINGQPISAKPWTWRTRMHRWILRHRLELAGGVVATARQRRPAWVLQEATRKENPEIRDLALKVMGSVPHAHYINHLVGLLRNPDASVRLKAVRSLGQQKDMRILKPLMQVVATDPECRAYATKALNNYLDEGRLSLFSRTDAAIKSSVRKVSAIMADHNRKVEEVLNEIPSNGAEAPDPIDEARRILGGSDLLKKFQALRELGDANHPMAEPLLFDSLRDLDVGTAAAFELAARTGDETLHKLIPLLKDPSTTVRANASTCMGLSGLESAVDPLVVALSNERDEETTIYIIRALGELRSPDSIPGLRSIDSRSEQIGVEVKRALQRIE